MFAVMKPIPLLKISGSHFEAGRQLGAATADTLREPVVPPEGRTWDDMRHLAQPYVQATQAAIPWLHDEMEGIAAGSGVDVLDLYARATEEIWEPLPDEDALRRSAVGSRRSEKCSDFAAGPPATLDGGVWLAHNNDLGPEALERIVAIEWQVEDQPRLFTLGVGPFISIGCNAAGLSLTGNEVSPNDDKIGLPRLLLVRDILAQRTAQAALAAAARPERASSYNQLISHADGTMVNFEGSATAYELIHAQDGWTVHTNHYCSPKMAAYERDPSEIAGSCRRYERARELMATRSGPLTPEMLKTFLSDHANAPDSLCRHEGETQTVFWAIIDLSHGAIEYGRGQPCASTAQYFRFQ
jgi:isopenicillin-N N-acyltransferase like protein